MDDDDMEETFDDVDDEEVKLKTDIEIESLVAINKGSIEDCQMKDMEKLPIGQTCDYCDYLPDNNCELKSHLGTVHNEVILQYNQCEDTSISEDAALKHVRKAHEGSNKASGTSRPTSSSPDQPSSSREYGYSRNDRLDDTDNVGNKDIDSESRKQDPGDPNENDEQKHLKDSTEDNKEEQGEEYAS